MLKKRSAVTFIITATLLIIGASAASAQSSDSKNPTPLTGNSVEGNDEPRGQSHYYSFYAGPGDVTVSIDGVTDYYSANVNVVLRDEAARELSNLPLSAYSDQSRKVAKVHLARKTHITMQLMFAVNVGVHLKYKVSLDGPVGGGSGGGGEEKLASAIETVAAPKIAVAAPKIALANAKSRLTGELSKELPSNASGKFTPSKIASAMAPNPDNTSQKSLNTPVDDKWALIVGISKFQHPSLNLKYSAKDAKDLAAYLVKEAHFAPDHVKLITDEQATKERIMAEIGDKWLPRMAHPNDLVLIFISSHGSPSGMDLEGLNYLVMHNTDPESLYATGLPIQDLTTAISKRVHSDRVLVVLDACHSGAANTAKGLIRIGNFNTADVAQGTGQLVICSSQPNQVSWESKRYENGVFTHQLIEALRSQSGKTSLGQAFEKMKSSVQSEVLTDRGELQTPVLKSKWQGNELIISAPPSKPRAVSQ
ncbi:MAG: caspase family protein [Leptolyngbya sp.]|nr:caspase family protein [Candidatus Melainabacteria bacterium]